MEPFSTVVLGIAGKVLTDVLLDLIIGGTKAARKKQIIEEVARQLARSPMNHQEDITSLAHAIMSEIEVLSDRSSSLTNLRDQIRLTKSRRKSIVPTRQLRHPPKEITRPLDELHQILSQRREELGLSTESVADVALTRVFLPRFPPQSRPISSPQAVFRPRRMFRPGGPSSSRAKKP